MKFKEFLNEAPLPAHWDHGKYKGKLDYKEMIRYAESQAQTVGKGSSRVAFDIDYEGRKTVLKVARNMQGISQNVQELKYMLSPEGKATHLFIPVIDYDEENRKARWIHCEYAFKITDDYFKKHVGVELGVMIRCIMADLGKLKHVDEDKYNELKKDIHDWHLYNTLKDFLEKFPDIEVGDLARLDNWGLYKGQAVILDIGYDSISRQLYWN